MAEVYKGITFFERWEVEAALEDSSIVGPLETIIVPRTKFFNYYKPAADVAKERAYDIAYLIGGYWPVLFGDDQFSFEFYKINI